MYLQVLYTKVYSMKANLMKIKSMVTERTGKWLRFVLRNNKSEQTQDIQKLRRP